ncbi:MAG TPA: molybdopterin-dependent oxidoreductase, partial [Candidatus Lokiarchaeia archaeon]|nr:molybdopterin-dependent oxidoreductase [Candidatus Lokiarchaeia archaeon]
MVPLPKPLLYFIGLTTLLALPLLAVVIIAYSPLMITPNGEFFVDSINGTPQIDANAWHLSVNGMVDHPLTLTYQSIITMPNVTETAKLICVDGPSGTAVWTGVPLNTILAEAGVQAGAVSVVFYGADGYSSSLALPQENTSDVLLAWEMNQVPLPPDHGYPIRVVAPNEIGYKWVKWVVQIQVVNYDYQGYWESRGYSNNGEIAPTTDWRLHAALFSVAFLLGGLAAVSGIKMRPESTTFR